MRFLRTKAFRRWRLLTFPLWIYLGIVVVFAILETKLMYPAPRPTDGDWEAAWLEHEDVYITTKLGNTIHGWYCPHAATQTTILICHGNGEHVAYMAEELEFLRDRYAANVFAFDYRGYGKSPGSPFEAGVLADSEAAHQFLVERAGIKAADVVVWGRSLGGAAAIHVASQFGARGLVLDRTFDSMLEVAVSHFPWLPVRWVLRDRYPSAERIAAYDGPIVQVHGRSDAVVPFERGELLFDAAPSVSKHFITPESFSHNAPWPAMYYDEVQRRILQEH